MNLSLLRAGESHQFENYWRTIWPRVGLPSSDQVDLGGFGSLADFILVGKFTPSPNASMVITYVGQGITDILNNDITGSEYFATVKDEDRQLIIRVFEAMVAQPCGRWRIMHYGYEKGYLLPVDTTFFPFTDAATGEILMGALIMPLDDAAPSGMAGRALTAAAGDTAQWINMGHGVPADLMLV